MLPRVFLMDDLARNIKCSKCSNYLSKPPIFIRDNDPVSGKCANKNNSKEVVDYRAYFYEDLAKFMFFPCVNDAVGCTAKLPFGNETHEANCKFTTKTCPAVACRSKIACGELLHHYQIHHTPLLVHQGFIFPKLKRHSYMNLLFQVDDYNLYVLQIGTAEAITFFRLTSIQDVPTTNFSMIFYSRNDSKNSITLNNLKIMKYELKLPDFNNSEKIDLETLEQLLGPDLKCEIKIEQNEIASNPASNEKMLSELECPVCVNYMTPPIFMCSVGHSICSACRIKVLKCPSCFTDLSNTRNFALEKISEIVTYPCKNTEKGCNFTGNTLQLRSHESICFTSNQIDCFTNHNMQIGCYWKGKYSEIYQHLLVYHPEMCSEVGYQISFDMKKLETIIIQYLHYNKKIFKLILDFTKGKNRIAVVYLKDQKSDKLKYFFYLDFIDDLKMLTISEQCHSLPISALRDNSATYVKLTQSLIKPFIKRDKLYFKIHLAQQ